MITSLMEQFYQGNVLDDDFWSHAQFKLKVDLAVG